MTCPSRSFPFVSIIVVNYDGARLLVECLRSVLDLSDYPEYEVLVVDNGSKDDSVNQVMARFSKTDKIGIIPLGKNFGFAEGSNLGYANSSPEAKYIVFLNNDVTVRRGWLRSLVMALEEREDVGVAQPVILSSESPEEFSGGYMDVFGDWDFSELNRKRVQTSHECFYAQGAALITRRKVIQEIGLFNPRYFWNFEETDFCWRSRLAGYNVAVIHSSEVYHVGSATMKRHVTTLVPFHIHKNRLYTLLVNYEVRNIFRYASWAIISQIINAATDIVLSVLNEDMKMHYHRAYGFGRLVALLYILAHIPDIWRDRLVVQKLIRKRSDREIVGKSLVIPQPVLPNSILAKVRRISVFLRIR